MSSTKLSLSMIGAFLLAMAGTYGVLHSSSLKLAGDVTDTTLHEGGVTQPYLPSQPIPVQVSTPQPQVITKEVPGPERVVEKIVPGPERIVEKIVNVPGPERVVEKVVTVPGPERIVEKIVNVPGPERVVVKEVRVPFPSKGGDLTSSGFDLWTILLLTGSLSCGIAARKMYLKKQRA